MDAGSITQQDYLPVARGSDETYKIPAKQFVVNAITQGSGIPIVISKQDGAGQTLLFRSLSGVDGISIVNIGNTTVVSGSGQNPIKTVFTGTGSQVNFPFTLTNTSSRNVNNYRVDIDGVLQEPGQTADYFLSGSNLTFTSAPPLSSKIVVISNNLLPLAESVPPDNSVSTAKLSAGAVTTDKIALSAVTTSTLANRSVTTDKIALSAVTTSTLANKSVTTDKIALSAVTTSTLANKSVTTDKIALSAVTADRINLVTSLSTNGYQIMPGGLIMQWGKIDSINFNQTNQGPYLFPESFPNNCLNIVTTIIRSTGVSGVLKEYVNTVTLSSFKVYGDYDVTASTAALYWQAIGF